MDQHQDPLFGLRHRPAIQFSNDFHHQNVLDRPGVNLHCVILRIDCHVFGSIRTLTLT
jgi:hypothetical protein